MDQEKKTAASQKLTDEEIAQAAGGTSSLSRQVMYSCSCGWEEIYDLSKTALKEFPKHCPQCGSTQLRRWSLPVAAPY